MPETSLAIEEATDNDLAAVTEIFQHSFADSLMAIFAHIPDARLVREVFRLCREADPDGLLVARLDGRVAGYIYVPVSTSQLKWRAITNGYLWRMADIWLHSDEHSSFRPLLVLALDKYHFIRSDLEDDVQARVLSIAVAPWARGRGVGSRLVERGLARLQHEGVDKVRLEVRPDNEPARRMYQAAGFEVVGETEDSRGPWLIMVREL